MHLFVNSLAFSAFCSASVLLVWLDAPPASTRVSEPESEPKAGGFGVALHTPISLNGSKLDRPALRARDDKRYNMTKQTPGSYQNILLAPDRSRSTLDRGELLSLLHAMPVLGQL